jgi:hypothetical protein
LRKRLSRIVYCRVGEYHDGIHPQPPSFSFGFINDLSQISLLYTLMKDVEAYGEISAAQRLLLRS